ncbi:HAD family hydrolase [Sphingomonas sp. RB3P16]|uniref:HAD family hydrolase n=1 Tax=Parasphingomonas frigoris TaxID=3096163 RepID=UPI002FC9415F
MDDMIFSGDLPTALEGRRDLAVLSLDCFDTLLWRQTHAPSDVFRTLRGPSAQQRVWAEQRARSRAAVRHRRNEVAIADIYAQLLPNAAADVRAAGVTAELAAEAALCFGFAPTIALMVEARRVGLRVIITSDTYLDRAQLGELIARAAGDDVRALIDSIHCSSDYGLSKGEGLIREVIRALGVRPESILHVGDNRNADFVAGQAAGVQALHLKQFSPTTEQRLRLEAATSAMLHVGDDRANPNRQPHRAAIAIAEPRLTDPAERLGYTVLGPVLYGFAKWIADEATALRATSGGKVHLVFLMRDGYLPQLVFDAIAPATPTHATEISRFTATAASFANEAEVLRYLEAEEGTPAHAILKQLLFEPNEISVMLRALPATDTHAALTRAVRAGPKMRRVLARSQRFAERLVGYLRATIAPAAGDTLMLVDLGYNGSVQNQVDPLLRRLMGVQVAGRYLLLREQLMSGFDKAGFIASAGYDANTLEALCGNVAVLEQLCTAAQGSVIDYTPQGLPVRAANAIKGRQSETRDAVQRGVLAFAREAGAAMVRPVAANSLDESAATWPAAAAAAVLARLMYLPMPDELAVLEQFQHDVNLGVGDTVPLFDPTIARRGLRQRGLFYMRGAERMYLPAELHGEGLAVRLTLLAHKRFGLALKYADFVDKTITLPVLIADGRKVDTATITATPTHDGYFIAPIPIDDCRFAIGLQFGRLYEWLQVESATFMPVDRFLSEKQRSGAEEIEAVPTLEGMERTAPHLFRCEDDAAFMMIPPPPRRDARKMMLAVVFRPIVIRDAATAAGPSSAATAHARIGEETGETTR